MSIFIQLRCDSQKADSCQRCRSMLVTDSSATAVRREMLQLTKQALLDGWQIIHNTRTAERRSLCPACFATLRSAPATYAAFLRSGPIADSA